MSYAVYLVHFPVFVMGQSLLRDSKFNHKDPTVDFVARMVELAVSFALGAVLYHGLEVPFARWRKRLRHSS